MTAIIAYSNNNPTMKYDNTVWLAPLNIQVASYWSGRTTMAGKYEQEWRCCKCQQVYDHWGNTWWRHQMETFSALLAICAGNSPVPHQQQNTSSVYNSDGTWASWRLKSPASPPFVRTVCSGQHDKLDLPVARPKWGESTGHQWIHLTKGQWLAKRQHCALFNRVTHTIANVEQIFIQRIIQWNRRTLKAETNERSYNI